MIPYDSLSFQMLLLRIEDAKGRFHHKSSLSQRISRYCLARLGEQRGEPEARRRVDAERAADPAEGAQRQRAADLHDVEHRHHGPEPREGAKAERRPQLQQVQHADRRPRTPTFHFLISTSCSAP